MGKRCATITVRSPRGRVRHAVTEGAESPMDALCGQRSKGWLPCDGEPDCEECIEEIERLGWN